VSPTNASRRINLNAGTLYPTPGPVLDAVTALRREQAEQPSDFQWRRGPALINTARAALAGYLRCDARDLLLLPNVTYAINTVVTSLDLPAGSEVLWTDHEYGAMRYLWQRVGRERGWTWRELTLPFTSPHPDEHVAAFERAISDRTRVLFFCHATSPTGLVLPAESLCRLARERGLISVVDGAHAPGMVPVDLAAIDADFYAANCHKWVMAPAGAGFLHARRDRRFGLKPLVTSWGWEAVDPARDRVDLDADGVWGGSHWHRLHEFHGTADRTPQMALPAALAHRQTLGGDAAIRARCRELAMHCRRRLAELGLTCVTPATMTGAMSAFALTPEQAGPIRERLWRDFGIEAPVTEAAGRHFLRVSTAVFVTPDDLDALAAALNTILTAA
jgi:isopenicillin-N epimerase